MAAFAAAAKLFKHADNFFYFHKTFRILEAVIFDDGLYFWEMPDNAAFYPCSRVDDHSNSMGCGFLQKTFDSLYSY